MSPDRRVAFLDRDGVVTVPHVVAGKGYAPRILADLSFYPDAAESVNRLRGAGFDVVIVTNQPDVSAGLLDEATLDAMHAEVSAHLAVTRIRACTHSRSDGCQCRKPLPGMLLEEARSAPIDFTSSWMVGDRDSDIEAGLAVGSRTLFIDRGWAAETGRGAEAMVTTLTQAVDTILSS